MKKLFGISILAIGLFLTGCATIVSESNYPVNIQSNPSGANFTIKNRAGKLITRGTTPQTVLLKAGAGYFKGEKYQITFNKAGSKTKTIILDTTIDPWYAFGNLGVGGLVGYLIIDPLTGAMYKLPEISITELEKNETKIKKRTSGKKALNIMSLDDLTVEQREKLIPIL